jgi:hypothetical protein
MIPEMPPQRNANPGFAASSCRSMFMPARRSCSAPRFLLGPRPAWQSSAFVAIAGVSAGQRRNRPLADLEKQIAVRMNVRKRAVDQCAEHVVAGGP